MTNEILKDEDKRRIILFSLDFYSEFADKVYGGNLVPDCMEKAKQIKIEILEAMRTNTL